MPQTTDSDLTQVLVEGNRDESHPNRQLFRHYRDIVDGNRFSWSTSLRLKRPLGSGGQGTVFLAERVGSDGFVLPVAIKAFAPEPFRNPEDYDREMRRIGQVASTVARIQHESLVGVHHFLDRNRIRLMVMEWIQGFDLRRLLTPRMYGAVKDRFSGKRWEQLNKSLITAGPSQPRIRSGGVWIIVRDCLSAMAALHRENIVHADIKPSNIMVKRNGRAILVDVGSAIVFDSKPERRACTPAYAAPEVLAGQYASEASDLASLGYVAIEMLTGSPLFSEHLDLDALLRAKETLSEMLPERLPSDEVDKNLLDLLVRMTAANPADRMIVTDSDNLWAEPAGSFLNHCNQEFTGECQDQFRVWIDELLDLGAEIQA